jgi:hypothetical protein
MFCDIDRSLHASSEALFRQEQLFIVECMQLVNH